MGNCMYMTTRRHMKPEQLLKDLLEISTNRFQGKLPIKIVNGYDDIFEIGFEWPAKFEICLSQKNKIEGKLARGNLLYWIQCVIYNDLALIYNGWITDDGSSDVERPSESKYTTFDTFIEKMFDTDLLDSAKNLIGLECKPFPKELLEIVADSKYIRRNT